MSAFSVALARRMAAGWMSAVGPTKPPGPSSRQGEAGGVGASGAARGSDGEAGRAAAGFFIQLVSRFARGDFRSFFWIVEGDADAPDHEVQGMVEAVRSKIQSLIDEGLGRRPTLKLLEMLPGGRS